MPYSTKCHVMPIVATVWARPSHDVDADERSNSSLCTITPEREKSHMNSPTRRFAGSAASRRREYRRAEAEAHSCTITARLTRLARRGVSSRARARGPARSKR